MLTKKLIALTTFVFLFSLISIPNVYAWYSGYSDWQYRKSITIIEQSGNTLTDYQVKLTIDTASFISSGKMNSDCSDMRFTYYDGSTEQEIPYWIESGCNSDNTIVWVKVPEIPANENVTIYIYYGNSEANSESNGDNVFELFDDFKDLLYNTSEWTTVGTGTVTKIINTKFTAQHGGQGLTCDGSYFYWGRNNGNGANGTIYKIDMNGNEISSFTGPPHSAGGSYRYDRGTILFSSGGAETPVVWEINSTTGEIIHNWNFEGEGYNAGALVAYIGNSEIYLFTADNNLNFKIQKYLLFDNNTWKKEGIEYSHSSLGTPQGLTYYNGYLYYLYDNGISKLQLNSDGTITILSTISLDTVEKEGLTYCNNHFYYGNSNLELDEISDEIVLDVSSGSISIYSNNKFGYNTEIISKFRTSATNLNYPGFGYGNKEANNIVDDSYNAHGITIGKIHSSNSYFQGRESNDGTNRAETDNIESDITNYHIYGIGRLSDRSVFYVDGDNVANLTEYYPTEDLYVGIGGYHGDTAKAIADWFFVKKYVFDEPTGIIGNEETNNWQYRTPINITEQSGNTLTDYQVKLTIDTASLISQGKMNPDCSDIRFSYYNTTEKIETKIPYWIESGCNTNNTIIWIKVPYIPANGNATVYMYYGNKTPVTSESNADDVFLFFDDFNGDSLNTSKWDYSLSGGEPSISNGILTIRSTDASNTNYGIITKTSFDTSSIVGEVKIKSIPDYGGDNDISVFFGDGISGSEQYRYINNWLGDPSNSDQVSKASLSIDNSLVADGYLSPSVRISGTTWGIDRIVPKSGNLYYEYYDGTTTGTLSFTNTHSYTSLKFGIEFDAGGSPGGFEVDWVRVRKYTDPEPTYNVGSEESNQPPPTIVIISPQNKTYRNTNVYANFTVTDDYSSIFHIKAYINNQLIYDNSSYHNNTEIYIDLSSYINGHTTNNFTVWANDTDTESPGVSTKSVIFTIYTGWYSSSWKYRTPINITEQSGNTLTDYQVKLTIDTASLISEGKMNSDCSDIRFTYYDGSTEQEIPYWIESGCNSQNTIVWVKVPEIPANSQTTIYMYYGNSEATSESDKNNTFPNYKGLWLFSQKHGDTNNVAYDLIQNKTTTIIDTTRTYFTTDREGNNNEAYYFDNNEDFHQGMLIENQTFDWLIGDTTWTYGLWLNWDTNTTSATSTSVQYIIEFRGDVWMFLTVTNADHKLWARVYDGSNFYDVYSDPIDFDTWYFVTVVANGTHQLIYVNGELQGVSSINSPVGYEGSGPFFGTQQTKRYGFAGKMDKIFFIDKALTSEEVMGLYTPTEPTYSIGPEELPNQPPQITIYEPQNTTYFTTNLQLKFKVTDAETSTFPVKAYLDDQLIYDNSNYQNNTQITLNLTPYITEDKSYNFTVWANDTDETIPQISAQTVIFTVKTYPQFTNITVYPLSPQTYGVDDFWFNTTIYDELNNQQSIILETNLTGTLQNYTMLNDTPTHFYYHWTTRPGAGNYIIKLYANDTAENTNSSSTFYAINKATPLLTLEVPNNKTYDGKDVLVNYSISTINNQLEANLYLNNNLIDTITTSGSKAYGSAGVYSFVLNTSGNENYTAYSVSGSFEINKANANLTLQSSQGWEMYSGSTVTISASSTVQTPHLKINNITVENPYTFIPQVGFYDVYAWIDDYQNYTDWNVSETLSVMSLPTCVDNETFAFKKTINANQQYVILNFSLPMSLHHVKDDLTDVKIDGNVSSVHKNNSVIILEMNSYPSEVDVYFGNEFASYTYQEEPIPSGENVKIENYEQINPYLIVNILDEETAQPLYPPESTLYAITGCSLGQSIFRLKENTTKFLVASKTPINEMSIRVKYTADAYYKRTRFFDNITSGTVNIYVSDATQHAVDRIDLTMGDPAHYNSLCQFYKKQSGHDVVVTEARFDTSHQLYAFLLEDTEYNIRVIDPDGSITEYGTITLVEYTVKTIGESSITVTPSTKLISDHITFNAYYNEDNTTHIDYIDDLDETESLSITIRNSTGNTIYENTWYNTSELHMDVNTSGQNVEVDLNATHKTLGNIKSSIIVVKSTEHKYDVGIDKAKLNIFVLAVLLAIAGLVSTRNFITGIIIFDVALIVFKAIGWITISLSSVFFVIILTVIAAIIYIKEVGL